MHLHPGFLAETVGFEPTDGVSRQTISSRSRYDHFDTSPYLLPDYYSRIKAKGQLFCRAGRQLFPKQKIYNLALIISQLWDTI